jgi:hypothetical protein
MDIEIPESLSPSDLIQAPPPEEDIIRAHNDEAWKTVLSAHLKDFTQFF